MAMSDIEAEKYIRGTRGHGHEQTTHGLSSRLRIRSVDDSSS
jgi:hypothetical protein